MKEEVGQREERDFSNLGRRGRRRDKGEGGHWGEGRGKY